MEPSELNPTINAELASKIESLNQLANEVEKSEAFVKSKLHSFAGRTALWLFKKRGKIPDWARNHIFLTQQLDAAVKEIRALSREKNSLDINQVPVSKNAMHILQKSKSTLTKLFTKIQTERFLEAVQPTLKEGYQYLDESRLLLGKGKPYITQSRREWHTNLGLLMNIYNQTEDPDLKEKISFLALNYLAKAAPINIEDLIGLDPDIKIKLEEMFQFGLFQKLGTYHRSSSTFEMLVFEEIQRNMASKVARNGIVFLLDTADITPLLPLKFSLLTSEATTADQLSDEYATEITEYLIKHFDNPQNTITDFLAHPILLNLSSQLPVITGGDEEKEKNFEIQFHHYEKILDDAVKKALQELKKQRPALFVHPDDEEKMDIFIKSNIICISLNEFKKMGFIKVLPIFYDLNFYKKEQFSGDDIHLFAVKCVNTKEEYTKTRVGEFITLTGIRLGGVKGREQIFHFIDLPTLIQNAPVSLGGRGLLVEYGEPGPNVVYFKDPSEILNSAVFVRFRERIKTLPADVKILSQATLNLIEGLLTEITPEKWAELNANRDKRQLFQTTLMRMMHHLAQAENQSHNFNKFTLAIELIQSELASLLSLTMPFKEEDFAEIYQTQLTFIPSELQPHVKIGLAKSAMNIFAGIHAAIQKRRPQLESAYAAGSYYEEVSFMGQNKTTQEILQNPAINQIDLYVSEFNHNINIDPDHTHYQATDIQAEIEALLAAKPQTDHLTVAIDCTIDYIHSAKNEALLKHFSTQIQSGKLNFIFFRSGQKFDMLGMDNYYGATFYMINNGDRVWEPFNELLYHAVIKTDPLSLQWFCLINKCSPEATDAYRKQIFQNTRKVLDRIPPSLKPGANPFVSVSTVEGNMEACFIDIKIPPNAQISDDDVERLLHQIFAKHKTKIHSRGSFGFIHPNLNIIIPEKKGSTVLRLNPGLDPSEVEIIVEFLNELAKTVAALPPPQS